MVQRMIINIMMMMMIILVMMIKGIYKGDVIGNYSRTSDSWKQLDYWNTCAKRMQGLTCKLFVVMMMTFIMKMMIMATKRMMCDTVECLMCQS